MLMFTLFSPPTCNLQDADILLSFHSCSIWDWKDASETNFKDARSLASDCWTLDDVSCSLQQIHI